MPPRLLVPEFCMQFEPAKPVEEIPPWTAASHPMPSLPSAVSTGFESDQGINSA